MSGEGGGRRTMELLKDWSHLDKKKNSRGKGKKVRMKRKQKSITVGKSKYTCRKCEGEMFVKKHPTITEKQKEQVFYLAKWYFCLHCNRFFFD